MNRRVAGWVVGVSLLVVAAGLAWWWLAGRGRRDTGAPRAAALETRDLERRNFDLYFPAEGDALRAERRELGVTEAPKDRVRKLVEALLAGPTASGLARPFAETVKLGSVQISPDGVAYIDLRSADQPEPPAAGSSAEIQRVYSLVNTITFNVPQITRVAVLWNGAERLTFAGHLDTSQPLLPDRSLLAH